MVKPNLNGLANDYDYDPDVKFGFEDGKEEHADNLAIVCCQLINKARKRRKQNKRRKRNKRRRQNKRIRRNKTRAAKRIAGIIALEEASLKCFRRW